MAKLRYVVGVTLPDDATAQGWLDWLRNGHIAEVLAGGATSADIFKIDGTPNSYEIEYFFPSRAAFAIYERDRAPRLRDEGRKLFPPEQGVVYRRTTGELIQEFSEPP